MKCPNCGKEVYFEEVVDTEYYDNEHHDIGYGTCDNCHKTWGWTEVFTYSKVIDVQEMENDHL